MEKVDPRAAGNSEVDIGYSAATKIFNILTEVIELSPFNNNKRMKGWQSFLHGLHHPGKLPFITSEESNAS